MKQTSSSSPCGPFREERSSEGRGVRSGGLLAGWRTTADGAIFEQARCEHESVRFNEAAAERVGVKSDVRSVRPRHGTNVAARVAGVIVIEDGLVGANYERGPV